MSGVRSICPFCGVGCGVIVETARGVVTGVRGDPDHPTNRGGLCAKGQRLMETMRPGDRLLHPAMRPELPGGGPDRTSAPRRVRWRAAVERVAGAIRRAQREHGPDSVGIYLSGQLQTEDYYVANKLAKGLLGTANVDTNSRLCMASTVAAYRLTLGADGPPGCYEDLDLARDVFLFGSNAADTHPILFGRLRQARRERGAHWTVIDPRRTATADEADDHLALRPGTDVALCMAMCAVILGEGLYDEATVRRTCRGLDELRCAAAAMPPERAAAVCGLPAARIVGAARRLARSPAALSLWCQGLNQSTAGTDKVAAVIDLHLITGQIGRPGAGPLSLTGQSNAMGGREVGGMATELAAHRRLESRDDRAEVERFWGLGPVPRGRGLTAMEMIEAARDSRLRVLWVACTNPAASLPDGAAVGEALKRLDLLVVQELYHPTDTGRLADVLLPAAGWAEKAGTVTSSERRIALAERAVPAPGEALPDWVIFAAVARELGGGEAFAWDDSAQVFAEHAALTRGRDLDMTGLDHDRLRRSGPQQWPFPEGGAAQARRYEGGHYATSDGRAALLPVRFRETAETPDAAYPLRLTTGRDRDAWHTLTRTERIARLRGAGTATPIRLHPDDAAAAGVEGGAAALVESPRGGVPVVVALDPGMRPGTAFLPFHRGPLLSPAGWTNLLPSGARDPISHQPELKHTVVRVRPLRRAVAIAGGPLAAAVADLLTKEGMATRLMGASELEAVPEDVIRVVVAEAERPGLPWWDALGGALPADPGVAVLDLEDGPEPLNALPTLIAAGWRARRLGSGGLPDEVLAALDRSLPDGTGAAATLRVASAVPAPSSASPGVLTLIPGGEISCHRPLSGDPATLAALVAGRLGPHGALRRVLVPLSPRRTLVAVGETSRAADDSEQGVQRLVHEDRGAGLVQIWRLGSGQALGCAAVVESQVAGDIEELWLADAEPALIRRRFPVR